MSLAAGLTPPAISPKSRSLPHRGTPGLARAPQRTEQRMQGQTRCLFLQKHTHRPRNCNLRHLVIALQDLPVYKTSSHIFTSSSSSLQGSS
jgi:hypothetical protein